MAAYFAMRLEKGKLNYNDVIARYPQFKDEIDQIIAEDGYIVDENGNVVKPE